MQLICIVFLSFRCLSSGCVLFRCICFIPCVGVRWRVPHVLMVNDDGWNSQHSKLYVRLEMTGELSTQRIMKTDSGWQGTYGSIRIYSTLSFWAFVCMFLSLHHECSVRQKKKTLHTHIHCLHIRCERGACTLHRYDPSRCKNTNQ